MIFELVWNVKRGIRLPKPKQGQKGNRGAQKQRQAKSRMVGTVIDKDANTVQRKTIMDKPHMTHINDVRPIGVESCSIKGIRALALESTWGYPNSCSLLASLSQNKCSDLRRVHARFKA